MDVGFLFEKAAHGGDDDGHVFRLAARHHGVDGYMLRSDDDFSRGNLAEHFIRRNVQIVEELLDLLRCGGHHGHAVRPAVGVGLLQEVVIVLELVPGSVEGHAAHPVAQAGSRKSTLL